MQLHEWFEFEAEHTFNLYPFEAKCVAAKFHPELYSGLLQVGHNVVNYVFGRGGIGRQIRAGKVTLYFPERWLATSEKRLLMSKLVEVHAKHELQHVHVVTGEAIIVSDFFSSMVRCISAPQTRDGSTE